MPWLPLLTAALLAGLQPADEVPIRVGNAQVDPVDLSVTYDFVNESNAVTAYEVSITRYFSDGSTLVSTQGQDWFPSIGCSAVRAIAYSLYESWLPRYPAATPGRNLHRLASPLPSKATLIWADVTLTAVIQLDGGALGSRRVLERLFSDRSAMLTEYAYWLWHLRTLRIGDPQVALASAAEALSRPRDEEVRSGPRECLHDAAVQGVRWSENHPEDAARIFDAIIKVANQQQRFLVEQAILDGVY